MMRVKAAVLSDPKGLFNIQTLTLGNLRELDVLVRVAATGMCHTDAAVRSRDIASPLPIVLGHEGAGTVIAVGSAVQKVAPGDHVVLTFQSCGSCVACHGGHPSMCQVSYPLNFGGARMDGSHALHADDYVVHDQFFGQSSFATHALAHERNVVKVAKDVPLELLGPLGCGFQTGAGAVLNALKVGYGESLAVFGSGAVGLAAVMAARVAGATTIIAVDIVPSRLELAKELGATHTINSLKTDIVSEVMGITGVGVQYGLDTTGRTDVIRAAVDCLRSGGTCGILGASPPGAQLSLDVNLFMGFSKRLMGIVEGDSVPDIFIPKLIELYRQGRFPFDRLIKFYPLEQINQALEDSEKGITIKPVIRMPQS